MTRFFVARPWRAFGLAALCLGAELTGSTVLAADALDRLQASTMDERTTLAAATGGAEPWVHCLFPGQVRRLGMSMVTTPRRAARVSPSQCQAGGGEYIEPQDPGGALKIWLPLAAEGVPDAQVTAGELYERQGQTALAKVWYEKAAAQGLPRAQFNLASLIDRGTAGPRDDARVTALLTSAGGGLVAGLALRSQARMRIDVVAPEAALVLPVAADGVVQVQAPSGPAQLVARVTAPAGLVSVKANGQAVQPDAQGLLSLPVQVGEQAATVVLEAADREGQLARTSVALVQRSAPPSASSAASPAVTTSAADVLPGGRRWALVVANQGYRHWPKLDTPLADARAVAEQLRQRFGYEVQLLQDANRQQMLAALSALRVKAGPQDQVVVYYAGHGQMDTVTARGYWIPVDGDATDLSQWVSVIDVSDQLSAMQARHVMVIADACYSGTLTRSLLPRVDQALSDAQRRAPLQFMSTQRARVALTSGGLEPVVDGGSVEHSLFARSLLDVLAQVKGPVAAQELHDAVSARFAYLGRRMQIKQQPHYAPIGFAGHEAGDFVLAPM